MTFNPLEIRKHLFEAAPFSLAYKGQDIPAWKKQAREKIAELLGLPQVKPDNDEFTVEWTREYPGHKETRFYFKSESKVWALGHLLIPNKSTASPPLVICLQGHNTGMHVSLGRNRQGETDEELIKGSHAYALQCLSRGYAAMTLELRGFGENGGNPEDGRPACRDGIATSAMLVGRTLQGERVWDISRSIDAILAHLNGFDPNRIAIMGVSGGGSAAFYSAIIDERISAVLLGCSFCSYTASIGLISHCICNYIPHVMEYFDMGDLAGLIAPRPLVIVNGKDDHIFPAEGAEQQFKITKTIYKAMGAEDKCDFLLGDGGHGFYPGIAWDAFAKVTGWV